jgi:transcriptional regulator with XRE-family HTH domain
VPVPATGSRAFGQAIRELRKERNLTQERLAARGKMDRGYLGGVERGERNPGLVRIMSIAEGLGTSASAIFRRFEEVKAREAREREPA